MTCREKLAMEHPDKINPNHSGGCEGCPEDYGYLQTAHDSCDTERPNCVKCWDREIPEETMTVNTIVTEYPCATCDTGWGLVGGDYPKSCHDECDRLRRYYDNEKPREIHEDLRKALAEIDSEPVIKDSGDRTQFASGAVRDMRVGKGRFDLAPLEVMANYICENNDSTDAILWGLNEFLKTNSASYLYSALNAFDALVWNCPYTMMLEVAKHYEEGALKYGPDNWRKSIPTWCYIDSAARHYLKWMRGDREEPHARAFVWNVLCCIWEVQHGDEWRDAKGYRRVDE